MEIKISFSNSITGSGCLDSRKRFISRTATFQWFEHFKMLLFGHCMSFIGNFVSIVGSRLTDYAQT